MKIEIQNNKLTITEMDNFDVMLSYLYLYCFEFVSDGLFVPSLNPPTDNDFAPDPTFHHTPHRISYKKTVVLYSKPDSIEITFQTIKDAQSFKEELERTW